MKTPYGTLVRSALTAITGHNWLQTYDSKVLSHKTLRLTKSRLVDMSIDSLLKLTDFSGKSVFVFKCK